MLSLSIGACGAPEEWTGPSQNAGNPGPLGDAGIASGDAMGQGSGDARSTDSADARTTGSAEAAADGATPETDASAEDAGDGGVLLDAAESGGPEQCVGRRPPDARWKLVWSDEFEKDGAPDSANWGYENGFVRNEELQWYQPDNAAVAGGLLTIAAQPQTVSNPNYVPGSSDWRTSRQYAYYTSTSMTTEGKHSFEYGRFETCAKIDTRLGSWPAFWILGDGRPWPASGEVDIMEYYTNDVNANVCKPAGATCDWTGSVQQSLASLGGAQWSNTFHLWAMEWDSQHIDLYLDDALVYAFPVASAVSSGTNPYTGNPFYVIVNLAIGSNGGDPSGTMFPIQYQVDYVRVYQ